MRIKATLTESYILTPREGEVLRLICEGLSDKLIARRMQISANTVSTHVDRIYEKLEIKEISINHRCAAIGSAVVRGLITLAVRPA